MFNQSLAGVLADTAWKSVAVLGIASVVTLLLRRRSAAARHLVWTAAFAALLALPLLSLALPAWQVRVDPALVPAGAMFRTNASNAAPGAAAAAARQQALPPAPQPAAAPINWAMVLLLLWSAGAGVAVLQIGVCWAAMWRVRRAARPIEDRELDSLAPAVGIDHPVDLLEAGAGSMPMAFGLLRPAVFLPAEAASWSAERRQMVLLHELAHVRRGDLATHLLAKAALSLYWWNPLAWRAWREFLKERERATDDLVLQAGARASDYAGHLLEIARTMQASPRIGWAAVSMARPSQLEGRLLAILDSGVNRGAPGRNALIAAAALAVILVAPFAAMRAQAQDRTATLPADVDATIRAAAAQKNHEMLDSAAKVAEVMLQYDMAQKLLESSLAIREDTSGAQSVDYGVGLVKLGDLERSRGNTSQAQEFYTKAVAVLASHPQAVPALLHLGTAALSAKDEGLAMDYFQRAQVADPTHAGMALNWMAIVKERQKDTETAESLFRNALAEEEPQSPESALTQELLASLLQKQGREVDATAVRAQATALRLLLGSQSTTVRRGSGVTAFRVGNGISAPALISKVEPQYTEEARMAKYQGTAVISVTIDPEGKAQNMRVVRGLGLGLDDQAMKAISQWVFKPGTQNGQAVPVMATIEVNFRLL